MGALGVSGRGASGGIGIEGPRSGPCGSHFAMEFRDGIWLAA
jgi:hypothetical protein